MSAGTPMAAYTYEDAREATRRAAFLNTARSPDSGEEHRIGLAEVFRSCRDRALTAGLAKGLTAEQVDAEIAQMCEDDVVRLRQVTDEEFTAFANESGDVVTRFLLP